MGTHAYLSIAVTLGVFLMLYWRRGGASDLIFLAGLMLVTLCGVIRPEEALRSFASPAVIMIGALFVVAAGLRATGALDLVGQRLLGNATSERTALVRISGPIVALSALMNNTPVVAMLVPTVIDWCRRIRVSPSRLLIPVSYLAILGGACTLIGTSTNLVVNDQLTAEHQRRMKDIGDENDPRVRSVRGMGLFEIGYVGLPCALVGSIYLLVIGRRLLPNRTDLLEKLDTHRREYLVEMSVQPECRLIGQTVEQAGLRNLAGLFLIEIDRDGQVITPVTPGDTISEGDRLVFTGVVSTIVDLEKIPGLVPVADTGYEIDPVAKEQRHLTEAVLSNSSPLIGTTVKEAKFRRLYNAAVIAVHRNGVRVTNKVGNIRLEAGDTLLLQTRAGFLNTFRNSQDFYLVSGVEGSAPRRHHKVWLSFALLAVLVASLAVVSWLPTVESKIGIEVPPGMMAIVAVAAAGFMVATRCLSMADARAALDLQILLTIGAALGLGRALHTSGAAEGIADGLISLVGGNHPLVLLAVVYLLTVLLTEVITNVAVAAIMFSIALEVAQAASPALDARPFIMAIALAASCSFITPIGYQTNLMVMGPGGYRPTDFLKVGLPLTLLVMATSLLLIPHVWAF